MSLTSPESRTPVAPIRVLHVDDEPDLADLTSSFLEREEARLEVSTATSPGDGLARLRTAQFDCIVSDYDMPEKNGIEFLEAVRAEYPDLPFVLYTGKGSEEVASEAISAGVTDYLQKESGTDQYKILANRIVNAVEQTRAERERHRMRERMELALEYTDSIIFEIDCETGSVIRHGTYEKFFDFSTDDAPTWEDHLEQAVHPADRRAFEAFYRAVVEGGRTDGTIEYRTNPELGPVRWIQDTVSVEPGQNGDRRQAIGVARDITEYKERQRKLREKERRYQAVFNDPNILVGLLDTDGTVLDINQTAMEYVDTSLEEVTGQPFWETPWFDHSEAVHADVKRWVDRAASGEYVEFETELVRPDGTPYTIAGVFRPVTDRHGEVVSLLISDRDVTDQKERERELTCYQAYLEESTDVNTVLDEAGTIEYQSPSSERILGYEPDTLVGENVFEYVHPDDVEEVRGTLRDLASRPGASASVECRVRTAGDEWRWLEVRATNQLDHDAIAGIVTTSRDITARKERERELKREHSRFRGVFEESFDAMVIADDDGRYVDVNGAAEDLFGVPEADLLGKSIAEFAPEDYDFEANWGEFHASERERGTFPLVRPDGEQRLVEYAAASNVAPGQHLSVLRDVTDRREREQVIDALHGITRDLITANTDDEIAELVVEAAVELLDLTHTGVHIHSAESDALVPTAWTDEVTETIGTPPALERDSLAWDVFDTGEAQIFDDLGEYDAVHNLDTALRSEIIAPLGRYGVVIAGSTARNAFDDTDRQLLELLGENAAAALLRVTREQLFRDRESDLEGQNERLEAFASVVSHDLRNPLSVAAGRIELAREECDSEHLRDAADAIDRGHELIDDLLALAREGERTSDLDEVHLGQLIESGWETVETGDATLVNETDLVVRADESRVRQLLENLVRNSVEHGGDDVTVTVGELDDGFYLEDDGPGIPAPKREAVFEPGYSCSVDGTGFGLSIVTQVVEAHDWEIRPTESRAGGARFEITGVDVVDR